MKRRPRTTATTPKCRKFLRGRFIDVLPVADVFALALVQQNCSPDGAQRHPGTHHTLLLGRSRISLALNAGYKLVRGSDQCPTASDPRVRGSAAPTMPCGVTAIELAEVRGTPCTSLWPRASSSWITSAGRPRSSETSSGSH